MTDVIFVMGAGGGAGATTFCSRLGFALAAEGERTLLVDGDSECAQGLEICGLQGLNVYTLADAEDGACRIKQALLRHPKSPNFYVLPTLGARDKEAVCRRAVSECKDTFDVILCDGVAAASCTRAILVCEPYPATLKSVVKRAEFLKDCGFKDIGLFVNKVNGGLVFDGLILTPQETASLARIPLWGIIPEDTGVPLGKIKPLTAKAYTFAARKILGKDDRILSVVKPYCGVRGFIKRRLRERI